MRKVSVRSRDGSSYAMQVEAGNHRFVADEDEAGGGDDLGPVPYDLLLAGIGSCTAITLLMYARRKQWPVEDVQVDVSHEKVPSHACDECSDEERQTLGPNGRVDRFHIQVSVKGDLDSGQLDRLLEIANRCPVHRTVEAAPKFSSSIAALA